MARKPGRPRKSEQDKLAAIMARADAVAQPANAAPTVEPLPPQPEPAAAPQSRRAELLARAKELGITDLDQLERGVKRELATRHLYDFIKQGWRYIDPAPFVDGWHLRAICEHLEAVTRGEIRNLLINIPPRHCKSILVSVAFAPWVWIQRPRKILGPDGKPTQPSGGPGTPPYGRDPLRGSHVSFLYASYSQHLSLRDSIKARRLIESPWYKNNWPQVKLTSDVNTMGRFENTDQGYRLSTSVAGTLTGEGGDIICLSGETKILTRNGWIAISVLVNRKINVEIAGYDYDSGRIVWQRIQKWEKSEPRDFIEISTGEEKIICTEDHPIYVEGKGYVPAIDVWEGDVVVTAEHEMSELQEESDQVQMSYEKNEGKDILRP